MMGQPASISNGYAAVRVRRQEQAPKCLAHCAATPTAQDAQFASSYWLAENGCSLITNALVLKSCAQPRTTLTARNLNARLQGAAFRMGRRPTMLGRFSRSDHHADTA